MGDSSAAGFLRNADPLELIEALGPAKLLELYKQAVELDRCPSVDRPSGSIRVFRCELHAGHSLSHLRSRNEYWNEASPVERCSNPISGVGSTRICEREPGHDGICREWADGDTLPRRRRLR